jgi:hypothetical protein
MDWGVFTQLKRADYKPLKEYLLSVSSGVVCPYSSAHLEDLMKSDNSLNSYFKEDLELLQEISRSYGMEWNSDRIKLLQTPVNDYYEAKRNVTDTLGELTPDDFYNLFTEGMSDAQKTNLSTNMKTYYENVLSNGKYNQDEKSLIDIFMPSLKQGFSIQDLLAESVMLVQKMENRKTFCLELREKIKKTDWAVESNSGNWDTSLVINNIDTGLLKKKNAQSFRTILNNALAINSKQIDNFQYFKTAYLLLDMLGYKSDRFQKENSSFKNTFTDSEHSYFSTYCDYFVVDDKNLRAKSSVLLNEFNLNTKILHSSEVIAVLENKIHKNICMANFDELLNLATEENLVHNETQYDTNGVRGEVYKLPFFYLNFFTHVLLHYFKDLPYIMVSLVKDNGSQNVPLYFLEVSQLIDDIFNYVGVNNRKIYDDPIQKFIYSDENIEMKWKFAGGWITLRKDENGIPILVFAIETDKVIDNP